VGVEPTFTPWKSAVLTV